MADSGGDKRVSERRRVHWRMLVLMPSGEKKPGYVLDVSEGGLRMVSMYSFPIGSTMNIAVFVPDMQKSGAHVVTSAVCKVIYQVLKGAEVQLGLEFVKLDEKGRMAIRSAMNIG